MAEQNSFLEMRECNIEDLTSSPDLVIEKTLSPSKYRVGSPPSKKRSCLFERLYRNTVSPPPIINEFSDQRHRSKVDTAKRHWTRVGSSGPNLDSDYRSVHKSADLHIASHFDRLLYGSGKVDRQNQILALERERLLTTIQNTSAMLQSTVNMLISQSPAHNDQPSFQTQQIQRLNFKLSNDSGSLEQSTKYTMNELDNLLNSLQSNDCGVKVAERRKVPVKNKFPQYDVIHKWLNNKIRHSQPSSITCSRKSSSSSSSSTSTSSKSIKSIPSCDKETIAKRELKEIVDVGQKLEPNTDKECTTAAPPVVEADTIIEADIKNDTPANDEKLDGNITSEMETSIATNILEADAVPILQEDWTTSKATEEKKEFLQSWLHDLKTRTHQYKESQWGSVYSHQQSKARSHEEEHEEFISLCKTMIHRVDSMISKASPDQTKRVSSKNILSKEPPKPIVGRYSRRKRESTSTDSSSFFWADLAAVEKDRHDFHTLQKCLANLEEMNMRRTNNALTQTLIIKELSKLIGRQGSKLANTTECTTERMQPNRVALIIRDQADKKEHTGLQPKRSPAMGDQQKTSHQNMYNVITKSIMYQDVGNNFLNAMGDPFPSDVVHGRWEAQLDSSYYIHKPNAVKINQELKRLQLEEQKSISLFWMYVAGLLFLSHFGIFRVIQSFFILVLGSE